MADLKQTLSKHFGTVTGEPFSFGRELLASVVVFLVALPLCMGIAIASNVPPALGLITGMVGGLVVGFFAGSPLQVSGPAAGLAVLVWQLIEQFGLGMLGVVVLGAGLIQFVCGLSRLGRWFRAVSPAVIYGMLAGIGVLIFSSQFHVMVDDKPRGDGVQNLLSIPEAIHKGLIPREGTPSHHLAAAIGLLTLIILVAWNTWKRPGWLKPVPGPLVAVVVATSLQAVVGWNIDHVSVPENLGAALNMPAIPAFASITNPAVIGQMFAFAFIASAETLLSAAAVDKMHDGARADFDRELTGQGIGNMICGVLGALPMTGVIVRSTANVEAGAKTRLSTILHGTWLLSFVAALPFVLSMIPVSSLAAVLVYTGYRLVNPKAIRQLYDAGVGELVIYGVTVVGIVTTDLLTGVLMGVGVAVLKLVWHFTHLDVVVERDAQAKRADVQLFGAATFVGLPKLAEALEKLHPNDEVHVHLEHVAYIDYACLELLRGWERQHRDTGGTAIVDWDASASRRDPRPLASGAKQRESHKHSSAPPRTQESHQPRDLMS